MSDEIKVPRKRRRVFTEEVQPITVRLPISLYQQMEATADREQRSLNLVILRAVQEYAERQADDEGNLVPRGHAA